MASGAYQVSARLCVAALVGGLLACSGAHRVAAVRFASDAMHQASSASTGACDQARVAHAFAAAHAGVDQALERIDPQSDAFRALSFVALTDQGDLENASLLTWFWTPQPDEPDAFERYLTVLQATGRAAEAQTLAWEAARTDAAQRPRWIRAWYAALAADPARIPPPFEDLRAGHFLDELDAFRGHSSIILKARHDRETVAVFKPHQELRHQSFRGEVASYRLCALIHCTFVIPESREAWFEGAAFRALAGLGPRDDLHFGTRRDLIFLEAADGTERLYGVLKAWVPTFTHFPIEYDEVWRPLVRTGVTAEWLNNRSLARTLEGFDDVPRGFYDEILRMGRDVSVYQLAQQLSEIHVFDVLINNFDRYQPEWYGMNAHWTPQGLLSIDNGASFSLDSEFSWGGTRRRAERIEVFSRSMIDALRWMDDEAAFAILFPPTPWFDDEQARFDAFVERRAWLLAHVDALVDQHGPDAVYLFP